MSRSYKKGLFHAHNPEVGGSNPPPAMKNGLGASARAVVFLLIPVVAFLFRYLRSILVRSSSTDGWLDAGSKVGAEKQTPLADEPAISNTLGE